MNGVEVGRMKLCFICGPLTAADSIPGELQMQSHVRRQNCPNICFDALGGILGVFPG